MSYNGTTAASSVSNPPIAIAGHFLGRGANTTAFSSGYVTDVSKDNAGQGARSVWLYATSDPSSALLGANYFTDAQKLGMRQADWVISAHNTGSSAYLSIGLLSSVTTNGANIASTNAQISSTR